MFSKLLIKLSLFLLPPSCLLCLKTLDSLVYICNDCKRMLPFLSQYCKCCGQLLASDITWCGNCLQSSPAFLHTYPLFAYQAPIIKMISAFKFEANLPMGRALSELLLEKIKHDWYLSEALPEAIVPVPLHPRRMRERGFNQALELAKPLGSHLSIPVITRGIHRMKHTRPQSSLPRSERTANVQNAFEVSLSRPFKHVAILDDVVTTGQTVLSLAKALHTAGIQRIDVWCCARA